MISTEKKVNFIRILIYCRKVCESHLLNHRTFCNRTWHVHASLRLTLSVSITVWFAIYWWLGLHKDFKLSHNHFVCGSGT